MNTDGVDTPSAEVVQFLVFAPLVVIEIVMAMLTRLNATPKWEPTEAHADGSLKMDGMILSDAQLTMLLSEEPPQEEIKMPNSTEESTQPS